MDKTALIGLAKGIGKFTAGAFKKDPLGTTMTLGIGGLVAPYIAPAMMAPDPQKVQMRQQRRMLANQMRMKPMSKISSARRTQLIKEALEKRAGVGLPLPTDPKKMLMLGAMLSGGAALTGAASVGAAHALGRATELVHKGRQGKQYAQMLEVDPSLSEDPKARAYFNILHTASPYLASQPHVAAATVRQMVDSPEGYGVNPARIREFLDVQKARQNTRYPALQVPTFRGDLPDLD